MVFQAQVKVPSTARRQLQGVSLIETLCSVTIAGILASTALPQFSDMTGGARVSVVNNLAGAVRSASSLVHAQCMVNASCPTQAGQGVVVFSDQPIQLNRGYPAGGHPDGIGAALQISGFDIQHVGEDTVFVRSDAPNADACLVRYSAPDVDGGMPRVAASTEGC